GGGGGAGRGGGAAAGRGPRAAGGPRGQPPNPPPPPRLPDPPASTIRDQGRLESQLPDAHLVSTLGYLSEFRVLQAPVDSPTSITGGRGPGRGRGVGRATSARR